MVGFRSALITGATGGIGRELARTLAAHGTRLVLPCRSVDAGRELLKEIAAPDGSRVVAVQLDSLASVAAAAEEIGPDSRIDLAFNNAGVGVGSGLTVDGFEAGFAVNYLSHFLLSELLLQTGAVIPDATVINVTSVSQRLVPRLDTAEFRRAAKPFRKQHMYAVSKRCQVLHGMSLAQRWPGLSVRSVHPGATNTPILAQMMPAPAASLAGRLLQSPAQAAEVLLSNATAAAGAGTQGGYFQKSKSVWPGPNVNEEVAQQLFRYSTDACTGFRETVPGG